jgi:hypothetical protein
MSCWVLSVIQAVRAEFAAFAADAENLKIIALEAEVCFVLFSASYLIINEFDQYYDAL